jgi:NAD(P)-dependent dehydrogenase (short-subunit alcohol dehydrogenase family)
VAELNGRVAVVTGAGRGIGRAEAILLAQEGARVVVNDNGCEWTGEGSSDGPAHDVVDEIHAIGGEAVVNTDDVSTWEGGRRLIGQAVEAYGDVDILICNAAILRNHMFINMTEEEWDDVIRVNLKGHFCPTRWAVQHWRTQPVTDDGSLSTRRLIFTSSGAGLFGAAPGVANYVASKAAILGLGLSLSRELDRYGVSVNTICPGALTRLSEIVFGADRFEDLSPGAVASWVAYLCTDDAAGITGQTFSVAGPSVERVDGWHTVARSERSSTGLIGSREVAAAVSGES